MGVSPGVAVGGSYVEGDVLRLDVAQLAQTLLEGDEPRVSVGDHASQVADSPDLGVIAHLHNQEDRDISTDWDLGSRIVLQTAQIRRTYLLYAAAAAKGTLICGVRNMAGQTRTAIDLGDACLLGKRAGEVPAAARRAGGERS